VERAEQVRREMPERWFVLISSIRFLRLSSEMFPFASHAKYGYDLSFADEGLKAAGDLANKYGHRITMHPGQVSYLKHSQCKS
jgi:UV DNA damage repair endonuclease